ncbi:MAG: patatin [Acidobacteria bacterium]|nr:MAG: patatin [Acidobacteriota bacterium]REK08572.1 MAG: patatin [Acidobacteriota bacterium]
MPRTALVLTGGGARAAYQVGLLRAVARRFPDWQCDLFCGVSAGAINATYLAVRAGHFGAATEELCDLWTGLTPASVFDPQLGITLRSAARLLKRFLPWRTRPPQRSAEGLVDTAPLRRLLGEALGALPDGSIPALRANLEAGLLHALSLTTIDWATGRSVTWVDAKEIELWRRPSRESRRSHVTVDHVLASSALPFLFPAVEIGDSWHGDGGVRLVYPLAPAVHMGADRILAVSTRYRPPGERDPDTVGYPPPAQLAGVLMNAVFLDQLDQDAERLREINLLLRGAVDEETQLRPIDLVFIRPSRDLGRLAGEFEPELPASMRTVLRGLGTRQTASPDILSMIMFQRDYVERLIEIGEADAEKHAGELEMLLGG